MRLPLKELSVVCLAFLSTAAAVAENQSIATGTGPGTGKRGIASQEAQQQPDLALNEYLESMSQLATKNRVGPAEAFDDQKAITLSKRAHLVTKIGETAVANLDKQRTNLFTDEFRIHNPDLAALCDACLTNSEEAMPLRILVNTKTSNPILIAMAHAPPFEWEGPSRGTNPYPAGFAIWMSTHKDRSLPIYLQIHINPDEKRKPHWSQTERIMVWQCSRNTANKLLEAYTKYIDSVAAYRSQTDVSIEQKSLDRIDEETVKANRTTLVALCGEVAISELDERNNYSTRDLFSVAIKEIPFDEVTLGPKQKSTFFKRFRSENPDYAQLCDAYFIHSESFQHMVSSLHLDLESNPLLLVSGLLSGQSHSYRSGRAFRYLWDCAYDKISPRTPSHTEFILLNTSCRQIADELIEAYRNYVDSLQKLAAINSTGPAEAVETQTFLTLERRTNLVYLTGEDAVAKLDLRFKNMFSHEFRKTSPELALLCEGYLAHSIADKHYYEKLLGGHTPNPLILVLSHSEPFCWEPLPMGTPCFSPPPFVKRWNDGIKQISSTPAYLRPPQLLGEPSSAVQIIVSKMARDAADKVSERYKDYCSSITNLSKTRLNRSTLANQLIARLNAMQVESKRNILVDYCGEEAVQAVDRRKDFTKVLKDIKQFD